MGPHGLAKTPMGSNGISMDPPDIRDVRYKGTWGYGKHRQNVPCVAAPARTFKPGTFALKGGTWVWQSATIPQLAFRLPSAHEDAK